MSNLPETCNEENVLGEVQISNEVIASIAGIATREVEGVAGIEGTTFDEFKNMIGMKNSSGISVEMEGRVVSIGMTLIIKYGYNLPKVSKEVQEKVKSTIESMTVLEVSDVNIRIGAIDIK